MMESYPLFVVPCRRGGVPCLTPDQVRDILTKEERVISLSIFDAYEYVNICKKSQKGFAEFCGLGEFTTILTVRSPHVGMHASAPATETTLCGNHEKGRISFSNEKWKEVVLSIQPSIAIPLYDAVSLYESQTKRRRTAEGRSIRWSSYADSIQNQIDCKLMKPLCVSDNNTKYVFTEELCQNETLQQYYSYLSQIGTGKVVMSTAISVSAILMCLKTGVSFIESALPWILAEKGIALVFDLTPVSGKIPPRYESQIDLNDYTFAVDIQPLSLDCNCYTCSRHTRAYIHHLLTVQEMNSVTLLTIHNLTRLVQLVRIYRNAGVEDRELLLNWVFAQL
ncbi:putative queuine tRNA-ribosyltransferase [Trypanosoma theileri]|uniref:Queuine tRNA-ribosyltransferase accessory subunit 2 n=1 Tax=Trypanosoma theileri TaxID=67003 RepID=A0A1X0NPI6_9TRYP|nr:putative queuine tRNA-ribosyltransferase [Trypanosoma theileri]ORC86403.1 putative queuine tRNA-ribosyltransferase [Trypanosoma theileri]